jgi:hypothetical protein
MARPGSLAALAAVFALVLPTVAFAGSAGDNQYQDPFGNSKPQTSQPKTTATPAPAPTPVPAQPQSTSTPTATTAQSGGDLPHTGLDLRVVAGLGVLLLASGLVLWRRTAAASQRGRR